MCVDWGGGGVIRSDISSLSHSAQSADDDDDDGITKSCKNCVITGRRATGNGQRAHGAVDLNKFPHFRFRHLPFAHFANPSVRQSGNSPFGPICAHCAATILGDFTTLGKQEDGVNDEQVTAGGSHSENRSTDIRATEDPPWALAPVAAANPPSPYCTTLLTLATLPAHPGKPYVTLRNPVNPILPSCPSATPATPSDPSKPSKPYPLANKVCTNETLNDDQARPRGLALQP